MQSKIRKLSALILAAALAAVYMCFPLYAGAADANLSADGQGIGDEVKSVPEDINMSYEEWEVLRLVNHERFLNGKQPLTAFKTLQEAAEIRALELPELFEHTRPDGSPCYTVLEELNLEYMSAGENIAAGYRDPASVVAGWMNSSGHRANILSEDFIHLGVGMETVSDEYGTYWEQFFYTGFYCEYDSISFIMPEQVKFAPGTSIDEMGITAILDCGQCGNCYMPVSADICSGYDGNITGICEITVSCCGVTGAFTVEIEESHVKGDVDGDGTVATSDALLAMRHSMGLITLEKVQLAAGDMDNDGRVALNDAILILRTSMGLI